MALDSEHWASALDDADQDRNHCHDEQNVNETTQGIRTDHAQQPEDQKQDGYSPEHWHSFPEAARALTNCSTVLKYMRTMSQRVSGKIPSAWATALYAMDCRPLTRGRSRPQ
jgi:hypothetical protein